MNKSEQLEDFMFLVNKFDLVHISAINGLNDKQLHMISEYANAFTENLSFDTFINKLNQFILTFNDSHSRLFLPLKKGDEYVNVKCEWLKEGIIVKKDYKGIKKGDRVVKIGNKNEKELLKSLKYIIPSENEYLIKSKAFNNYNQLSYVFSKIVLKQIGELEGNELTLTLERNGLILKENVCLEKYFEYDKEEQVDWIGYELDETSSLGIFRLNECRYSEEYKETVSNFFTDVYEKEIKNIALDLRENMGGDARVINKFVSYIDVDNVKDFSFKERYSEDLFNAYSKYFEEEDLLEMRESFTNGLKDIASEVEENTKDDEKLVFKGKVFTFVSNKTYSAAKYFAVFLKDNKISEIVGEPTGGKPSSFGNVVRFKLPNSKISFSVSTKLFLRPDSSIGDNETLIPDLLVYKTKSDVLGGTDSMIERIKNDLKLQD